MLPTTKTPPKEGLKAQKILAHGPPKIGKTSLVAENDKTLFFASEPGLGSQSAYQVPITSWEEFLEACKDFSTTEHDFDILCIDTINNLDIFCRDYICRKFGAEHETDIGEQSKGYTLVNREFRRVLTKLAATCDAQDVGLFIISHSIERKIKDRHLGDRDMAVPAVTDSLRKFLVGFVDVILFFDIDLVPGEDGTPTYNRVLRTKPSMRYEAGDRTGCLPATIPMSFAALSAAFNGKGGDA